MTNAASNFLSGLLQCPADRGALMIRAEAGECLACGKKYPLREGKIFFVSPPQDVYVGEEIPPGKWSQWRRNNFEYFAAHLEGCADKLLLDIGAGPSQFYQLTSRCRVAIGVDFYPYRRVQVIADLTQALPFASEAFDIAFMSNVLEHTPEPAVLLGEAHRVLKPGGMLLGSVPFLRDVHQPPYDFLRYTPFMLHKLLGENGFRQVEIQSLGTPEEVYRLMRDMFFSRLISFRFSENPLKNFWFKLWARFARKTIYVLHSLYYPIFSRLPPSLELTEGYGFKASK